MEGAVRSTRAYTHVNTRISSNEIKHDVNIKVIQTLHDRVNREKGETHSNKGTNPINDTRSAERQFSRSETTIFPSEWSRG